MQIIPPFSDDNLPGHQREGILAGCFENDLKLRVTSQFKEEASSLFQGIEQRYPLARLSALYVGHTEIPYSSLVVRVLNDIDVFYEPTKVYLDEPETTEELFRISRDLRRCRVSTVEIGLAALLIERAVESGYLRKDVKLIGKRDVEYLSLAERDIN